MTREYVVIRRRWAGGGMHASSDGVRHPTREEAIAHGEGRTGSDDFNVGELVDGKLVRLFWMSETVDTDAAEIASMEVMIHGRG